MISLTDIIIINGHFILCYLLYALTLQKETHFNLNRFFLLFSLLFPVLLPFITWDIFPNSATQQSIGLSLSAIEVKPGLDSEISYSIVDVAMLIYLSGLIFFSGRFLFGLGRIFKYALQGNKERRDDYTIIHSTNQSIFSFFKWLFWNEDLANSGNSKQILLHEETHIRQWHSLDILLGELIRIIFWFNPAVWLINKSIRLNHEYQADKVADLGSSDESTAYDQILLSQVFGVSTTSLENHFFNKSLTYKRIFMLNQNRSGKYSKIKYFLVVPLIGLGLYMNSCSEEPEKIEKTKEIHKNLDEAMEEPVDKAQPHFPGGTKAMMDYVNDNIKYPEKAKSEGIEGMSIIQFNVNEEGEVVDAKVKKGFNDECDAEALRVVKNMPDWEMPESKNGEEFEIQLYLPIKFSLSK